MKNIGFIIKSECVRTGSGVRKHQTYRLNGTASVNHHWPEMTFTAKTCATTRPAGAELTWNTLSEDCVIVKGPTAEAQYSICVLSFLERM